MNNLRIGQGIDAHAFCAGNGFVLGSLAIPYHQGIAAYSDGDVLIHAICDALLGAASLGDIGYYFPSTDPRYANASSSVLLKEVLVLLKERAFQIINVDTTIITQAPPIAPHVPAMRDAMATLLGIERDCFSVKATTTDHLGFTGRKEGLAVTAIALLALSKI